MRYAAIAFDLDGTLVDSAPDLHAAANRMLADLGRPGLTLQQVTSFVGNGVPKLVERCLDATGGADGVYPDALARY
ncbi:MAG TPA: HAD hydrolase-like protein, partial [Paracoccaceae bacterium]|nr:HAD hydrolase-like protein [Paracoccaceae bacterium]